MADAPTKTDYRSTVFLPRTDFPMKAGLPQKEPAILARWEAEGLYEQIRRARAGREKFILHDGPPYANGDIHIGHALDRTIKDMVVRTQTLLGKDAPFVPGWDCHGLPIEWKVEEQYRKKKLNKDEVPVKEFRAECRAYAQHWVDVQREELKRLGALADWDHPYLTMSSFAEATIVGELLKFAETGQIYRGAKPVMWSPVEKTALAEAEIEYEDITSTQIDVAFEIVEAPNAPELVGASAVVWTTTPWTIPTNQAIAFNPEVHYVLAAVPDGGKVRSYLVAEPLVEDFLKRSGLAWSDDPSQHLMSASVHDASELIMHRVFEGVYGGAGYAPIRLKGSDLAGAIARHPMHKLGGFFAKPRPFLPGDHVTTDQGTGLVHTSPDHGEEDFELCRAHGIGPVFAVGPDGRFREDWLWPADKSLSVINPKLNAPDGPINSDLREVGALLSAGEFRHSYPHSWRSKAKVIYRCTPQWFIAMDKPLPQFSGGTRAEQRWVNEGGADPTANGAPTLRQVAMNAIAATRFVPEKGRNRIGSMVEGRPDWVISRQRAWGVPIALFVDRKSGELLIDREVNRHIIEAVREGGVDAWSEENAPHFLGEGRNPDDYEMVGDILDVWFDSGSTHVFTLESGHWPDQRWPADLYLEGSDQHRGWFQSSLLESCGTRGRAPYNALLTHGFTMDSKGMKMSKSLGNTINPLDLMRDYGADILRLWALSVDFTEDHRIGKEILAGVADQYRKLRNTFRYLLGALDGFGEADRLEDVSAFPELERYILALLEERAHWLRVAVNNYDFNSYVRILIDFCNQDLSAFYFDIRKDCLYCEINAATGVQTEKRRAYRTVLDTLFHALVRWVSPVLVFTSEEVWGTRFPDAGSVHLLEWPEIGNWENDELQVRWNRLRSLRMLANGILEQARADKVIGSSLEANVFIEETNPDNLKAIEGVDLEELFIVSKAKVADFSLERTDRMVLSPSRRQGVTKSNNHKCGRCWRYLPEVREDGDLCGRCEDVVNG